MTPTQRTLALMRSKGFYCEVVERHIPHSFIKKDLAGFLDIVCLGDNETIGIQVTSASNVSARVKKITEHENVAAVRKAGWRILVHGWNGSKLREVDLS